MDVTARLKTALDLHQAGDLIAAAARYQAILKDDPDQADALHLLGVLLKDSGRPEDGVGLIERAVALGKRDFATLNNLALARLAAGRVGDAVALLETIAAAPGLSSEERIGAALNLALAQIRSGAPAPALNGLAARLRDHPPVSADVLLATATLAQQADLDGARATVTALAIALHPDAPAALFAYANALLELGALDRAATAFRRRVQHFDRREASHGDAWANYLFLLNFLPETTDRAVYEAARAWARDTRDADDRGPIGAPAIVDRTGLSRLRIGYLSSEFRTHHFLHEALPIFTAHDRARVEVVAFGDVARPDAGTARVEAAVDRYVPLVGLAPERKIETMRAARLDVLMALTGYRADQRALLLDRVAPYQMIAINNVATTGLESVDGHVTDPWLDPPDAATPRPATETLHRLATGYSCFDGIPEAPAITARQDGPIVFGAFNNLTKLTDTTLRLWARLLDRVPESRLLIQAIALSRPGVRRAYLARMEACGLPMDRVRVAGAVVDRHAHLARFRDADIALDPVPFPGGASSRDALWMGLPVITLAGATWMSRVGASILGRLDLDPLVAATETEYLDKAAALAADTARLAELRHTLRERMRASPLMDTVGHTRELEALYARVSG